MQPYNKNVSWARSFSPVAESDPYSSPTHQQDQDQQQQQQQQNRSHSQSSPGNFLSSHDYYSKRGGVLEHAVASFYPSPSYNTDRTVDCATAPSTSTSPSPSTMTINTDRHLELFHGAPSSCNTTRNSPYCSTGSSKGGRIHTLHPLLTTDTSITQPTARKVRASYQHRPYMTTSSSSTESTDSTGTRFISTSTSASSGCGGGSGGSGGGTSATASYHCQHPGCGKAFTRPYNLTSHMRTHTSERPFACSQCSRPFARLHDRNRHEKLHWNIKPHVCTNCSKPFARMDALNRHLKVENGCGSIIAAASRSL